jgi:epoxyqueuosine reductase
MTRHSLLTRDPRDYARSIGFDLVGVTGAQPFTDAGRAMTDRLDRAFFSGIDWFSRERAHASTHPAERFPWARSIVSVGISYAPALPGIDEPIADRPPRAVVARYARGPDHHRLLRQRLRLLAGWLNDRGGSGTMSQWSFDAGWLADRASAQRAGLGIYGHNSCLIAPDFGSWVLLGAVVTSLELPADEPARGSCGSCGACLAACPTGALLAPGVVDASRCVSYLTVEHAGSIPVPLRPLIGNRLVGCDACQEVCPHNRIVSPASELALLTPIGLGASPDAAKLLTLTDTEFDRRFKGSVVWRLGRARLARNAAVVLGNVGGEGAVAALQSAQADPSSIVREHAEWALRELAL